MSKKKEEPATITMTEEQLERAIKMGVKTALRELKAEEELPGNEIDELKSAPVTFSALQSISLLFLIVVAGFFGCFAIASIKLLISNAFNVILWVFLIYSILILITAVLSAVEIKKTKKIEVINTFFSAIMALSSLIVAIVGTYYAYKSTK